MAQERCHHLRVTILTAAGTPTRQAYDAPALMQTGDATCTLGNRGDGEVERIMIATDLPCFRRKGNENSSVVWTEMSVSTGRMACPLRRQRSSCRRVTGIRSAC
jgi:hypothetical protein